jgi:hypothetical protein
MFNSCCRYCAHHSQIMRWSRSLMRVKTGSVRSMVSDTNRVTSVQGGVIRASKTFTVLLQGMEHSCSRS